MKNIIIVLLVVLCLGVTCFPFLIKNNKNDNKEIKNLKIINDSLIKVVDSLKSDIFVKDIDLGRYEYMFDRAEDEMSPDCKKQLEKIYGETE